MAKSVTPSSFDLNGREIFANAVPDSFDARDLIYQPRLDLLPPEMDQRADRKARYIYDQAGESCTGHAVASVINHVLDLKTVRQRVSPYMLYRLARRYDTIPGDSDAGSSLRAAFKGWFNHGVALETEWPVLKPKREPDVDDEQLLRAWRARPLGAFYRVNPFRLDDVQSAITELKAIAVSGTIHDGWRRPIRVEKQVGRRTEERYIIARSVSPQALGGHAFCLVGYNETGLLVQNSWGTDWGKDGFATLPYEDWLDSAYDAWVARPGVPQTPLSSGRRRTVRTAGGALVTTPGPDVNRLAYHVLNTGNNGSMAASGNFRSTPEQLDRAFEHMGAWHDFFLQKGRTTKRHVMLWAHGGGVSEKSGLELAERHLNWWLNCGLYPITSVWETGGWETFSDAIKDLVPDVLPFGGAIDFLIEGMDKGVELGARSTVVHHGWTEMKQNARAASGPSPDAGGVHLVKRLKAYVAKHGAGNVRIHLAGHSAGSVYQASLVELLAKEGLKVDTLTWLAPAINIEEFRQRVVPNLGPGKTVRRFTCFDLSDSLELSDTVGPVYHKSAVYLVARGFEEQLGNGLSEVPILGLSKWWNRPLPGTGDTLRPIVEALGGELIVSKCAAPVDARTDAETHAGFDGDSPTMTSLVVRALGLGANANPTPYTYVQNAPLADADHDAPWPKRAPGAAPGAGAGAGAGARAAAGPPTGAQGADAQGALLAKPVEAGDAFVAGGGQPLVVGAAPGKPPRAPKAPKPTKGSPRGTGRRRLSPEVGVAPETGRPILDVLQSVGWSVAGDGAGTGSTATKMPTRRRTAGGRTTQQRKGAK